MNLVPSRCAAAIGLTSGVLALSLMSSAASAAVITFDDLTGEIADPFTSYTEDGFTVTNTLGDWRIGLIAGNPLPSIYVMDLGPADNPFGNLEVTAGGTLFTFNSLDLHVFNTTVGYEIRGYRDGEVLFSQASSQAADASFQTLLSGSSVLIDRLTFDISGGFGSFNVDNINVTPVPEPATTLLALSALGVLGAWSRQRAR